MCSKSTLLPAPRPSASHFDRRLCTCLVSLALCRLSCAEECRDCVAAYIKSTSSHSILENAHSYSTKVFHLSEHFYYTSPLMTRCTFNFSNQSGFQVQFQSRRGDNWKEDNGSWAGSFYIEANDTSWREIESMGCPRGGESNHWGMYIYMDTSRKFT